MPISPNQGSSSGNTVVTITGVNLSGATAVKFGDNNATITSNTPTSVTVISPVGTGAQNVVVVTNGGTSNPLSFYYIQPPFVTNLSVNNGSTSGGNTVYVFGYNLSTAISVNVGSNNAGPTTVNDGQIFFVVPAGAAAGSVIVTLTTLGGVSSALSYTYIDSPTIASVTPLFGSTYGGTGVTIVGTNLKNVLSVTFGGVFTPFAAIDDTTIGAITPANPAGDADIVITTNAGSATLLATFAYFDGPGI